MASVGPHARVRWHKFGWRSVIVPNCKNGRVFNRRIRSLVCVPLIATFVGLSSCSSNSAGLDCTSIQSVSGFVQRFSLGLDNFSENQYEQLRLDTLDAYDTVNTAAKNSAAPENAIKVATKISRFVRAMDSVSWDVTRAIESTEAVDAANQLASETTLREANDVESYVIRECGLPSTVPIGAEGEVTLPDPSIPSPTATDPTTNTINESSETFALGTTIANIFALTLDEIKVQCLGDALVGIVDLSDATSNSIQYQSQFQKAFDACEIDFSVPTD